MRKRFFCVLVALLLLVAPGASAARSWDLSYFTWDADFETLARAQLAAYSKGDLLTPVFTKLSAVKSKNLAKLVPSELDVLEKSLFAQHAGIEYYDYVEGLESKKYAMDIVRLDDAYRKAVERVRAERAKASSVFSVLKSGASVDLDGDGKKETVRFQSKGEEYQQSLELTIGGKKFNVGWSIDEIETVYIFDFDEKQKVLLFEYAGESAWGGSTLVFYSKGQIKTADVVGTPIEDIRYNGNNLFYAVVRSVPFKQAFPFAIDADRALQYGKERSIPVQIPLRFHHYEGGSGDRLTLKTIGGKTRAYADKEPFALIALSGMEKKWGEGFYYRHSPYAALVDKNGVALVLQSDESGAPEGGDHTIFYMEILEGAHFIS